MKAATKLASSLPFGELDRLVKAIGECKSKSEEDRIISAEVDVLKQRLSDPRLDKSRGREYMVRIMYCEMLGHDVGFAYIPVLQMASDPNLLNKKAAYLCLTQLLDYKHELVLLLVNTLLSDLKNDNFVVIATALVVTSKLIGADLINAVLPHVIERLSHPRESVRKKAVMALLHFHQMDPERSGPLAGVELERHFRTSLCDKEPSVMAATLNALIALAADNPVPFRALIPSLTSILKQVVEHRLPKAYDYHRFPAPFIQIKLLKLLRLLAAGDKAASDNCAAVVSSALRRAASGGNHTIGHAIVYEAVRTITAMYPNPALLASAAEAVAVLIKSPAHNLKYCGLTALAAITRVSAKYAQEHQMAVIDCLEDPDETLKLKTLELLVTMTKANNVQVVVERLMAFLRSTSCGGDEVLRRHIAGQIVELAEKYAPDTAWYIRIMAEVFEVAGDVLQPQLAHNLCRLIAEQDSELHSTAVQLFLDVLDKGTATGATGPGEATSPGSTKGGKAVLPDLLLCCICWVLGEYGTLADKLPPPHRVTPGQVMDKLCAAVAATKASSTVRAYLLTALTKLGAQQQQQAGGAGGGADAVLRPEARDAMHKARSSRNAELQQRAHEAQALLSLPPTLLAAVLPFDGSCEEFEPPELEEAKGLAFLEGYVQQALSAGATPYNPPPDLTSIYSEEDLEALGLPGMGSSSSSHAAAGAGHHKLRFDAYEKAQAPTSSTAASAAGGAFGSTSVPQQPPGAAPAAAAAQPQQQWQQPASAAAAAAPQLMLKGAGKGRWGPAEFSSAAPSSQAAASSPVAAAAVAPAAPAAASASSSSSYSRGKEQQRVLNERDRLLAASLFGSGDSSSTAAQAGGVRSRPAAAAPKPPPVADLLGGDVLDVPASPAQPAAAAAAGGLDLLMELDPTPQAAAAAGAAAPGPAAAEDPLAGLGAAPVSAAPAAGAGGLLDLGSILSSPAAPTAAAPAAGAGGGGADLLDLGLISLGSPQPQAQLPQMPLPAMGSAPVAAGAVAGGKGAAGGPVAMRGGQPAKGSSKLVDDPFKDLLG